MIKATIGKANYDPDTTLVKGYYLDSVQYSSIPEPYILISEEQHQNALGKMMCVINGQFQEYKPSTEELLEEAKIVRIKSRQSYLLSSDWEACAFIKYGRELNPETSKRCLLASQEKKAIGRCSTVEEVMKYPIDF